MLDQKKDKEEDINNERKRKGGEFQTKRWGEEGQSNRKPIMKTPNTEALLAKVCVYVVTVTSYSCLKMVRVLSFDKSQH